VKEWNGREAGEMIGHSRGSRVLMSFVAAFSHLHRVEMLITEQEGTRYYVGLFTLGPGRPY